MAELVLTDVDEDVIHHLEERARSHGRTPAEEARVILKEVLCARHPDPWAAADAIYDRLAASGRTFSDSADLLREDRDPRRDPGVRPREDPCQSGATPPAHHQGAE